MQMYVEISCANGIIILKGDDRMKNCYIFKYYVNAAHSTDNQIEHSHNHTFTISFWIEHPGEKKEVLFNKADTMIKKYLEKFSGKYLNAEPDFAGLNPTLENIGEVIYDQMTKNIKSTGFDLLKVEICENPLKVFSVSSQILLPSAYSGRLSRNWDKLIAQEKLNFAENKNGKEPERSLS